jgi:hypothetical protein
MLVSTGVAITPEEGDKVFIPSLPQRTEEEDKEIAGEIEEDKLVLRLLAGFHEHGKGRVIVSYPKRNSPDESKSRAALARQLRNGTLGGIARELLALAIDPETPSAIPDMRPLHKIEFKNPARRNKPTWARDRLVVQFIKEWLAGDLVRKEDSARHAAVQHFGLGRSRVAEIWHEYKDRIAASAK